MDAIYLMSRRVPCRLAVVITLGLLMAAAAFGKHSRPQKLTGSDRDRGHVMLREIKDDLKRYYYDPTFHGMDLDARFAAADHKIDSAVSNGQIFGIIAQALVDLDDSHTFFLPPSRAARTAYGWQMQMIGDLFDHNVKIGDPEARKEEKPAVANGAGSHAFTGKVIVLIDSRSASSAEIFARVMQIEKRGIVLGDRSMGAVMEAQIHPHQTGVDVIVPYAVSITRADLIMTDGKSLEKRGVQPDEFLIPTGADLLAGRDPVLARAAELAAVKLSPEEAGKLFPVEWMK